MKEIVIDNKTVGLDYQSGPVYLPSVFDIQALASSFYTRVCPNNVV